MKKRIASWFWRHRAIVGALLVAFGLWAMIASIPEVYRVETDGERYVRDYVVSHRLFLIRQRDMTCNRELEEGEPSSDFAVAYSYCDKQAVYGYIRMNDEVSEGMRTFNLKPLNPGEKGTDWTKTVEVSEADKLSPLGALGVTIRLWFWIFVYNAQASDLLDSLDA